MSAPERVRGILRTTVTLSLDGGQPWGLVSHVEREARVEIDVVHPDDGIQGMRRYPWRRHAGHWPAVDGEGGDRGSR